MPDLVPASRTDRDNPLTRVPGAVPSLALERSRRMTTDFSFPGTSYLRIERDDDSPSLAACGLTWAVSISVALTLYATAVVSCVVPERTLGRSARGQQPEVFRG
jgi:hypothetical protein